jgi:NTP pyrophosphatase (non-canonical NTP hydrolase)
MSLIDYQKEVHRWVSQFNPPYWPPLEMMARLSEETGEVAREINHLYGTKKKKASEDKKIRETNFSLSKTSSNECFEDKKELANELIDIFFTIICIANGQRINLEDAWKRMVAEKMQRDANRFEKK